MCVTVIFLITAKNNIKSGITPLDFSNTLYGPDSQIIQKINAVNNSAKKRGV